MSSKATASMENVGNSVRRSVQDAAVALLSGDFQGRRLTSITLPRGWTRKEGCSYDHSRSRERVRLTDFPRSQSWRRSGCTSCPGDAGSHEHGPRAGMVLLVKDATSGGAGPARTDRTSTGSLATPLPEVEPERPKKGHATNTARTTIGTGLTTVGSGEKTTPGVGISHSGPPGGGEEKKCLKVIKIPRLRPRLFDAVPHDVAISVMAGCAALWHLVHFAVLVGKIFIPVQPDVVRADLIVEALAIVSLIGLALTVWLPFKNTLKATLVIAATAFVACLQIILFILHSMVADHFRQEMNATDTETAKILAGENQNKTDIAEGMKRAGDSYSAAFGITVWDTLLIVCYTPPLLYAA